jgi:hypothetical protein
MIAHTFRVVVLASLAMSVTLLANCEGPNEPVASSRTKAAAVAAGSTTPLRSINTVPE